MTDKEENRTKDILDSTNYKTWRQELYLVLKEKDLNEYIQIEKLKKIKENELDEKVDKSKLYKVDGTEDIYFTSDVTKTMIKYDTRAKRIIINSIDSELVKKLDFISSTAYEIYNLITGIYEVSGNEKIRKIKKELENMKFDPEKDLSLSIFISNMNIKFNELEVLKEKLSEQDKFDYLYNSIPEELATKANLLTMKGNWEKITTDLVEINQKLKRVTEKKQRVEEMETNYSKVTKNENLEEKKKIHKI